MALTDPRAPLLERYLERLGLDDAPPPTLAGLRAIHAAQVTRIPYENIDVQQGVVPSLDADAIVAKVVGRGRGGWCYELNGTLAWALEALGFAVTRVAGAVNRHEGGTPDGNHLVLLVDVPEGRFIADVGLGEGALHPLPLRVGAHRDDGRRFAVDRDAAGRWRVRLPQGAGAAQVDFSEEPIRLPDLAPVAHRLATDPASPFVRNLVLCRVEPGRVLKLVGRRLGETSAAGTTTVDIPDVAAWIACIRTRFLLPASAVPDAELARLWG